ncbi:UDP-N-acetylmuramoyl-L-alanyl-D-glutamate--2,6-diaminopimelate ligase [Thiohalobacter sp. IOR34]|uniref:UDP-N-acetylmuramoyl-L-alanyl-D-glutamate--2, 6-diaminopimelate ligase n=1 Tax=Thiohalobacter sp. IOR34 TaxID=3057176 RepID=UPI0025B1D0BA|nr:UDP-N-acetylmuramoyl-L-alanyl-D-glutamate--2,6-diaminopimelate ligase [Thiohalobacter sp. IOR34]WJW75013.1 UDP-N-acetylmuramoyl-L-alanyl-D-glutamate--2,6-diaminopimelate ligase [Thiohalobacter sp. IOR34]
MMTAPRLEPGMRLGELLQGLAEVPPAVDLEIRGLALDSRRLAPGDLFLALSGTRQHGLEFAAEAQVAGAAAVAWEPDADLDAGAPVLRELGLPAVAVPELGARLGEIASRFHGRPSEALFLVGVTGTDGKTSCSHFIAQALHQVGAPCGLIGTLGYGLYGALEPGAHTTPDAVTLQAELAAIRDRGATAAVMEVSSHALAQARTGAVAFDVAVLTHLGRDHLDYHGSLEAYAAAKRRLFESPGLGAAVLNADDALGRELLAGLPGDAEPVAYGLGPLARQGGGRWLQAEALRATGMGLEIEIRSSWGEGTLASRLLGRFNASNLLAALGVLLLRGLDFDTALERLAQVRTVPGRMEAFGGGEQPLVVVDYAHTPRALEAVLGALREHCRGRLWCVFGAGGDRDRGKRPLMGAIAERCADRVLLTDDNPRREDPEQILAEILAGMRAPQAVQVERRRGLAIARALEAAGPGDVVLVAGKGHEDFQLVGDARIPFSDRAEVRRLLQERGS